MRFAEMTSAKLRQVDRDRSVAVIPIAAVEQHGPHMPTGTDTIICTAVSETLEAAMPEQILLTPTIWLGASSHHLRFGSTLDSHLDTYVATLCDVARSLLDDGYRRLLFLNGHGGNIDPMRMALRKVRAEQREPNALLAAGCYWSVAEEFIRDTLDGDQKFVGHACEFETSMILHLRPELIDHSRLRDAGELISDQMDGVFLCRDMKQRTREGYTGRPDLASAEKGRRMFDEIVSRLTLLIQNLLSEKVAADYEDFVC